MSGKIRGKVKTRQELSRRMGGKVKTHTPGNALDFNNG